ncbi:MAG: aminofutalosine synthase MqnE [Ammonifex sp.]|nr:MAG: aminofutalosine synthase MqnE [Ammonifex sp.]
MEELWVLNGELQEIGAKVANGRRLEREDGIKLFRSKDLLGVGYLADGVRRQRHGNRVCFSVNRHINHTNVCVNRCRFCAFSRPPRHRDAYTLSLEEIEEKVRQAGALGVREIHIVGGLNPELTLPYFLEMLRRVASIVPDATIKALTAVEVDFLARRHDLTVEAVLERLKEAGLNCLPGGGAEVFAPRVRRLVCPGKISGERWLEIHAAAHRMNIKTNATMLYGHVETVDERVDHLLKLRRLQDETGGFLTFVPLAFHPKNTDMEKWNLGQTTGYDDLKTIAAARLLLDNFQNIKAYWVMIGPKVAQVALGFGANDVDGTVMEEKITHSAGGETVQEIARLDMVELISTAGYVPVERDALYNVIREGF